MLAVHIGEQFPQYPQGRKLNIWIAYDPHRQAYAAIEHPGGQLQTWPSPDPGETQNGAVYFLDRFMDMDNAPGPGMPGIKNLAFFRDSSPVKRIGSSPTGRVSGAGLLGSLLG